MNKKILCLAAGLGLAVTAAFATVGASSSLIKADDSDVEWRHYDAVKATATSIGSREYWVSCATREVVFTEPTGEHVKIVDKKTHESDYLTYLAAQGNADARYTAYTPNAFKGEGNFWRYFRHGDWGTSDFTNGIVNINSNATITYKLIQDAHELGIKYVYFHATANGNNTSATDTITSMVVEAQTTTGKFSETSATYYQVNVGSDSGFGLMLDVENWYTTFSGDTTAEAATAFTISGRNSNNGDVSIKSMSFSDFNCFDTLESANAYKNLKNMFNTNGYDYFHNGIVADYDGSSFTYAITVGTTIDGGGNVINDASTGMTITKKLVEDVKTAGKTHVSFNVKLSTTETLDEGVTLNTVVVTANENNKHEDGTSVKWNDCWDQQSSDNMTADGVTITLDVSKLFDVTFTGDAFSFEGRLSSSAARYHCTTAGVIITTIISDLKVY